MAVLKVGIDGSAATRGASVVSRALEQVNRASRATAIQLDKTRREAGQYVDASGRMRDASGRFVGQGLNPLNRSLGGSLGAVRSLLGPLGALTGLFTAAAVVKAADDYTTLQNKLRLVTDSTVELNTVYAELFALSQRTRSGLEGTTDLYSKIARNAEQYGLSQREVLGITEDVAKAIKISGSSAGEAQAAILQFGQALASGSLRGDELRSVLENSPRLARAVADGLGVTIGELRKLGEEGKLEAEKVIGALRSQSGVLAAEFAKVTPTVSEGIVLVKNSLVDMVGELDSATGFSASLGGALQGLSKWLTENKRAFADAAFEASQFVRVAAGAVKLRLFDSRNSDRIDAEIARLASYLTGNTEVRAQAEKDIANLKAALDKDYDNLLQGLVDRRTDYEKKKADAAKKADLDTKPTGGGRRSPNAEADKAALEELKKLQDEAARITESQLSVQEQAAKAVERLTMLREKQLITEETYARAVVAEQEKVDAANTSLQRRNELQQEAAQILDSLKTPFDELVEKQAKYQMLLEEGIFTQEQYAAAIAKAGADLAATDKVTEKRVDFMEEIAKQAAQNIQTAFADFLFDPFEGGLKGMLQNFSDTLRRMAAEAVSQQILGSLFQTLSGSSNGILSTIGGFLGGGLSGAPGREMGGPVSAGVPYVVGERKPELFVPETAGRIVPLEKRGGAQQPQQTIQTVHQTFHVAAPTGEVSKQTQMETGRRAAMGLRMAERRNG